MDASGTTGCSGSPVVCTGLGGSPQAQLSGSSLVSNGVVWVGNQAWSETALVTSCNSGPPCAPIAVVGAASTGPATVSTGTLLVDQGGTITGYQT